MLKCISRWDGMRADRTGVCHLFLLENGLYCWMHAGKRNITECKPVNTKGVSLEAMKISVDKNEGFWADAQLVDDVINGLRPAWTAGVISVQDTSENKKCTCPDINFRYNGIGFQCGGT